MHMRAVGGRRRHAYCGNYEKGQRQKRSFKFLDMPGLPVFCFACLKFAEKGETYFNQSVGQLDPRGVQLSREERKKQVRGTFKVVQLDDRGKEGKEKRHQQPPEQCRIDKLGAEGSVDFW